MKKDHIEIPKPSSKFQKVNCNECGELQISLFTCINTSSMQFMW